MKNTWLELEGKVAIVTGSASGIGKAIAIELVQNGASVVISDINSEGQKVLSEINCICDNNIFIKTDITKIEDIKYMVNKTVDKYGKIDILINNAGINIPRLLVDPDNPEGKYELKESEFDLMVSINQKGTYLCAQVVAREMIKQKSGTIINITSECGLEGSTGQSCYAGTKGAIYAFTRSWAKELGKYGLRVVGVAPGIIEKTGLRTEEYENALAYTRGITAEELRSSYNNLTIPLKRVGRSKEIADLVCYLASDRASYIDGVTYNISGGKSRG
ncbi:SDR family oxidoreductase [Thermoanaerobacterium thermosaccharolyticum]|uniref:Sorbitol-6-phosphate 2-dehydrogenase n=1 Tax=Thermoanaerobacterium thermosaccharolyticum M0795 TaxID=698948 RepID=L0IIN0_THETR|nr:SDR family oxidoreductase [Thermoanaerobacterium thermosaccharolyticum]AGB19355.1 dehydrogenase of unknown specificity, short-chain alcohol dehydrogenase like protein [Thermoanaerobacterium thermosaccharolyticum M0795]